MKLITLRYCVALMVVAGQRCTFAAGFRNLDFEDANISGIVREFGFAYGSSQQLTPGWKVYTSTVGEVQAFGYNNSVSGLPVVQLTSYWKDIFGGTYSFLAGGSLYPPPGGDGKYNPLSISQTGTLPVDARTIKFSGAGGLWGVMVNDTPLSVAYDWVSRNDHVISYSFVDISQWAGQEIGLTFMTKQSPVGAVNYLDNIEILNYKVIPEPGTLVLVPVGICLLAFARNVNAISKAETRERA